jgi:preprotein translocase subunit SecG
MLEYFLMTLMLITSIFLILIVLVQRGRGGGLAGAFGGMGGQSAFGTKAGDLFTRITIGVAAFWIILCTFSVKVLSTPASKLDSSLGGAATAEEIPGATGGKPAEKAPGATGPAAPATSSETKDDTAKPAAETPAAETTPPAETAPPAETPKSTDESK